MLSFICKIFELDCATKAVGKCLKDREYFPHGALLGLLLRVIPYPHPEYEAKVILRLFSHKYTSFSFALR